MGNAVIITARMDSGRLPGKAIIEIGGIPNLLRIVKRLRNCKQVDVITVATTERPIDDPIVALCELDNIPVSRGETDDVIKRVYDAAKKLDAEYVLRATTDCSFISWELVDMAFSIVRIHQTDSGRVWGYGGRFVPVYGSAEFPYSIGALERLNRESVGIEREHPGMRLDVDRLSYNVVYPVPPARYYQTFSRGYRLELDTPEDLKLIRTIIDEMGDAPLHRIVRFLDARPDLAQINSGVNEKTGVLTSFSPEIRARWNQQQALCSEEWIGDWSWLTSGSPENLPKHAQAVYCEIGKDYLGYVLRGNDKVHRLHLLDGSIVTGRATIGCECGGGREWYADK